MTQPLPNKDDQGLYDYPESRQEQERNEKLQAAKDYVQKGKVAKGLNKLLDEDWFISRLFSWANDPTVRRELQLDALVRLGQLIHGFWRPYDKPQSQVADVTFTEKKASVRKS